MVSATGRLLGVIAVAALASWSTICAADVRASLDRARAQLNESFGLVLEVDSSTQAQPDFSVLERDFDVLSRSKSNNVSIVNGDYTATTRWNLDLMAKRAGELTVPAISVGAEASEPINISISQVGPGAPQNTDLFLEVSVEPREAYVQQQIIVNLQLFLAADLNPLDLRMSSLAWGGVETITESLGADVEFGTTRGTKRYRVIQRSYVIFPQESGTATIQPTIAEARVSKSGFGTFGRSSVLRSRSEMIELNIKPIPVAFSGRTWLPAKKLEIEENWSEMPAAFRVGEPSTRTLQIEARGLAAAQLPELAPYIPGDLKHYADQPELDDTKSGAGVSGSRTERYAIIPTAGGEFTLPEVEIPWWNTDTDRQETAVLPARVIRVSGRAQTAPDAQASEPSTTDRETERPAVAERDPTPWAWVSLSLALGWLLTGLAWYLRGRPQTSRRGANAHADPKGERAALARACKANEPGPAKDALLRWFGRAWEAHPPRSLGDIAARSDGPLGAEVRRLSEALYGKHDGEWRGGPLWEAFTKFDAGPPRSNAPEADLLPPLYRA